MCDTLDSMRRRGLALASPKPTAAAGALLKQRNARLLGSFPRARHPYHTIYDKHTHKQNINPASNHIIGCWLARSLLQRKHTQTHQTSHTSLCGHMGSRGPHEMTVNICAYHNVAYRNHAPSARHTTRRLARSCGRACAHFKSAQRELCVLPLLCVWAVINSQLIRRILTSNIPSRVWQIGRPRLYIGGRVMCAV